MSGTTQRTLRGDREDVYSSPTHRPRLSRRPPTHRNRKHHPDHEDLVDLNEVRARCVILDTNPDQPSDRRPSTDDWRALTAIANRNEPDAREGNGLTA